MNKEMVRMDFVNEAGLNQSLWLTIEAAEEIKNNLERGIKDALAAALKRSESDIAELRRKKQREENGGSDVKNECSRMTAFRANEIMTDQRDLMMKCIDEILKMQHGK